MRKYYHLLTLGRSKGLSISNKRWVHESMSVRSRHLLCHPRSLPLSPPPPASFSHYYHNHNHAQFSTLQSFEILNHERSYPLDYQVTEIDRDVVQAANALEREYWLPQSNLDLLLPPLQPGVFFCYKKKDDTSMSPETVVNTLKKSLAGVLSTFYPLAGEIVSNSQGEPEVLCNNNGVEFVHAHADVKLKNLDLHHPDETVKGKLVPRINRGLLCVQVTELNCGSIIVSCSFDHRISDANSFNTFLVAWAEFTQFKHISNIPSFHPSLLNPRRPPHYDTTLDNLYLPISSLPPPPSCEDQLCSRIYYIRAESINHLQTEASLNETRRSKLQSFTAFVWKLLGQDGNTRVKRTSRMGVIVNGRKYLSESSKKESSMLTNYFGNILSIPYGEVSNHHLHSMPLNDIAKKVNEFVTKAQKEEHFRGLIDWVELHRPEQTVAKIYFNPEESDGEAVVVSSAQGMPINDMNFGWGDPEFGCYHFPWGGQTGYITTMPSALRNGDWVVYVHLKQKDLDLIESKASHVFNPMTNSYLRLN